MSGRPGRSGRAGSGKPGSGKPASAQGRGASGSGAGRGGSGPRGRSGPGGTGDRPRGPRRSGGRQRPSGESFEATQPHPARRGKTARYGLGGNQVEGRQAVRELLLAGNRKCSEVHMASDLDDAPILDDIRSLARERRVLVREVSKRVLDSTSMTESAQGVVAFATPLEATTLDELCQEAHGIPPFLVALDGVTDPRNLGAVLRTADGAGATGIVLPRHRAVHVTPAVTKTAAGAIEHLPMTLVGGLPAAITEMQRAGIWVAGLDAQAERAVFDLDVATGPICLVLGAEGAGLSRLVAQRCDITVSIPSHGHLDSLNVSAAAAIACYEVLRRRRIDSV